MSVEQTDVVDIIGTDPTSGDVTLTITDHLPWDDAHLLILNKKLTGYGQFIEKGGLHAEYKVQKDAKIKILVLLKYRPNGEGVRFLKAAEEVSREKGIGFEFKPIPDIGYSDETSY